MRFLGVGALCALLSTLFPVGGFAAGPGAPATLTVHVIGGATRTALRLQPGFATVLRADQRVETVAIGDPRLVTATTVKRGPDVFDLVLQPQTATGMTNMIIWFGALTSIWDLTIGQAHRTADIVYVVTAAAAPAQSTPGVLHTTPPPSTVLPAPIPLPATPAPPVRNAPPSPPGPADAPYLEIQQTFQGAQAVFQLSRDRSGIKIRYQITNTSPSDFTIRPSGVLVRANGRLIPFGMSRTSADRDRPAVLPAGATEAGVIGAAAKAPRQVEVIFSLFPAGAGARGPSRTVPLTFQLLFTGLDRLTTPSTP